MQTVMTLTNQLAQRTFLETVLIKIAMVQMPQQVAVIYNTIFGTDCSDGVYYDQDGLTDCDDSDCAQMPHVNLLEEQVDVHPLKWLIATVIVHLLLAAMVLVMMALCVWWQSD